MKNNPKKQNRAFTLVETMVAISIMMLAILGPLSIASSGLRNAIFARDQITAYYLAQEGIEYVRYVRDNNYIKYIASGVAADKRPDWKTGLENCLSTTGSGFGCTIDMPLFFAATGDGSSYAPQLCIDVNCSPALNKIDDGTANAGQFTYQSAPLSPFRRIVKITPLDANRAKVEVTMNWATVNVKKTFTISEIVTNIY